MAGSTIGWFGKLPSHGDFLQRRVPENFLKTWDEWLQRCIADSRERLAENWLGIYLTSPSWRFFLSGGVIGASSFAGVIMPSVDRVGRYFPLTLLAELPADLPAMAVAIHGRAWIAAVETLALEALESEDFRIEEFDQALQETAPLLASVENYFGISLGEAFPSAATHWRLPMSSGDRVAAALIDPLVNLAARALQPMSLWWTDGSERVSATCLLTRSLPDPARFTSLLDGEWERGGWSGQFDDLVQASEAIFAYRVDSAGSSETGPVRTMNQDRFITRSDAGIWAVADGLGGHERGEYASQMVVDVLGSLEPAATLSAALENGREGLTRANDDLIRSAVAVEHIGRSSSTVAALLLRQAEWGVLWAGDSRVYLLREGVLNALTTDHSADQTPGGPSNGVPAASAEITRAVGGHDELDLDQLTGPLQSGDRFLLTSDGLHGAVSDQHMLATLLQHTDPQAAVTALVHQAIEAGSRDNVTAIVVNVVAESA